jgi:hypothetical protein
MLASFKLVGAGLATIGLVKTLLHNLDKNKLLSDLVITEQGLKAISTVEK